MSEIKDEVAIRIIRCLQRIREQGKEIQLSLTNNGVTFDWRDQLGTYRLTGTSLEEVVFQVKEEVDAETDSD